MTTRAIFKSMVFNLTADSAYAPGSSTALLAASPGMKTPGADFNDSESWHRIDVTAFESVFPVIASGATYTVNLSGLDDAAKTLTRITAKTDFTVRYTPRGGGSSDLLCVGSRYQPGIFETMTDNLGELLIVNDGPTNQTFSILVANVVAYDDPAVDGSRPPVFGGATGTNIGLPSGALPLGAVIPVAGTYTGPSNSGTYDEGLITPLPTWLKLCDGTAVTDGNSVMFGRFVPDLTDDRFIMGAGSTAAGLVSTLSNARDLTHTHVAGTTAVASTDTTTRTVNTAASSGNQSSSSTTRTTNVAISDHSITQPTFLVNNHGHSISHVHAWADLPGGAQDLRVTGTSDVTSTTVSGSSNRLFVGSTITDGSGTIKYNVAFFDTTTAGARYTTGVISPPTGSSGDTATSGLTSPSTTRTTDVALSSHSITQPTFTVDAHNHTITIDTQPQFTVDAHTHAFTTTSATWASGTIQAAPTLVDIRPKWIAMKFYMRVV